MGKKRAFRHLLKKRTDEPEEEGGRARTGLYEEEIAFHQQGKKTRVCL